MYQQIMLNPITKKDKRTLPFTGFTFIIVFLVRNGGGSTRTNTTWAWMRIRPYVQPLPSYTIGSEEGCCGGGEPPPEPQGGPDIIYNLTYDANGNHLSGFGLYFEYNNLNQLTRVRSGRPGGFIVFSPYLAL